MNRDLYPDIHSASCVYMIMDLTVLNTSVCLPGCLVHQICLFGVLTEMVMGDELPTNTHTHHRRDRTLRQVSGRQGSLRWHTFSLALTPRQNLAHIWSKTHKLSTKLLFYSVLSRECVREVKQYRICLLVYWHIDRSAEGHRLTNFLFDTPTILVRALFVIVFSPVSWQ